MHRIDRFWQKIAALFICSILLSQVSVHRVNAQSNTPKATTAERFKGIVSNLKSIQEQFQGEICEWFDDEEGQTFLEIFQLTQELTKTVIDVEHKLSVANQMATPIISDEATDALMLGDTAIMIVGAGSFALPLFVAEGLLFAAELGPWVGSVILEYWLIETHEITAEKDGEIVTETYTSKDLLQILRSMMSLLDKRLCCGCWPAPRTVLNYCELTFGTSGKSFNLMQWQAGHCETQ